MGLPTPYFLFTENTNSDHNLSKLQIESSSVLAESAIAISVLVPVGLSAEQAVEPFLQGGRGVADLAMHTEDDVFWDLAIALFIPCKTKPNRGI